MIRQNEAADKDRISQVEESYRELFFNPTSIQVYQTRKQYHRLFTSFVVLWCWIYQRLNKDHTCDQVVAALRAGKFDHLEGEDEKATLSTRCRSESTSGYCQARKRVPLAVFQKALTASSQFLRDRIAFAMEGMDQAIYLLDGSTLHARPSPELERVYGVHPTVKKARYWVVIRFAALFCLYSGALTAAKEGPMHSSETRLGISCILEQNSPGIYVGDRGFGIYSVAQAVRTVGGTSLLRLTRPRAMKLYRAQFYPGMDVPVQWSASDKDQVDPHQSIEPMDGRLIYVRLERKGFRSQDLYLFTTLMDREVFSLQKLVQIYGLRWQVEVDLRFVKTSLELNTLEGKSVDIIRKDLLVGLLAYNLVRLFMLAGARRAHVLPIALSFTMVMRRVTQFLFDAIWKKDHSWWLDLDQLLTELALCKLRPSPKRRVEPRWVRPRDKTYPEFWSSRKTAQIRYYSKLQREAI